MKDNIDKFLNRLLYSLYNLMFFLGIPIYAAVELLVQRPLYCLPFWKRHLKKQYGINSFEEYKDRTRSGLYKTIDGPSTGFTLYYLTGLALLLFALPIYLVINIGVICYGPHALDIVGRHLILVIGLGIVPSWIIGYLVYWKKDRYLKYFAIFEKEGRKKKIAWTIGTTFAFCLLIVANFMLIKCHAFLYG